MKCWLVMIFSRKLRSEDSGQNNLIQRLRPLLLKKLYPYLPQMKDANPVILKMFYGYKLEDVDNPFYSHLLRWNNSNHIKKHFSDQIKSELERIFSFE